MVLHLWDFGGQDIYRHACAVHAHQSHFHALWIPEAEGESEYEHGWLIFSNQPLDYRLLMPSLLLFAQSAPPP